MIETSGSLKLNKIELTDKPDITAINPNWDKIDSAIDDLDSRKADNTYVDTQDKTLSDKINVLSVDRGYEQPKVYNSIDARTVIKSGKYFMNGCTNMPRNGCAYLMEVTANDSYIYQKASCIYSPVSNEERTCFETFCLNGVWNGEWRPVATTTKTEILSTMLSSGWALSFTSNMNIISKVGDAVLLNTCLYNASPTSAGSVILTLPVRFRPLKNILMLVPVYINKMVAITIRTDGTITTGSDLLANDQIRLCISFVI